VDNPYLSKEYAAKTANSAEHNAAGLDAQVKSIVMLKNNENIIKAASEVKQTVYIPWKYTPETQGRGGVVPASWSPVINLEAASKYYNVVTDTVAKTLTGPKDKDGKPTASKDDIVRATAQEITAANFALVKIQSPQNGNPTSGYGEKSNTTPDTFVYKPISLQYRPYTADSEFVRLESIGGQLIEKTKTGDYGAQSTTEKENRSYFGQTGIITNESDLDLVLYAASVVDKVVVAVDWSKPMVFSEFENQVDAIVVGSGVTDAAFLDIISGKAEPSGLLPMQMPKNMETVEAQFEDVPRDMESYVDSAGNKYDFTFGLNWSGVISDSRTAKYNVAPLVGVDPFE
jgi:beta-glucosidase